MTATLSDIIKIMDSIAPIRLAEKWDNSGLQIGDVGWPVRSVMVALDPAPIIVETACRKKKDLLITHHPLIFKPLSKIDLSSPMGDIINKAIQNRLALYAAHTNLDSATGGINDIIAERIGLKNLKVLSEPEKIETFKLVFFVPADYEKKILDILFKTKAGVIGDYKCCSFRNRGTGTYKPGSSAKPFSGRAGEISHAEEIRIEAVVKPDDLDSVITRLKKHHPYETMAYDIYPLNSEISFQLERRESSFFFSFSSSLFKDSLSSMAWLFIFSSSELLSKTDFSSSSRKSSFFNISSSTPEFFLLSSSFSFRIA